jgi:hypothetical protein
MYSENCLPNIPYINRTTVLVKAREFSNQQENWSEVKKNIYIAVMVSLAGMGYSSALAIIIKGGFQHFSNVSSAIMDNHTGIVLGGMAYDNAHKLIIHCPEFQNIAS